MKQQTKTNSRKIVVRPIGEALRLANIAKPVTVATVSAKVAAKVAPAAKTVATAKAHKGLWFFQQTPGGNLLRAYFVGLMLAQMPKGKLAVAAPFKLWPNANLRGHIMTGKVEYKGAGVFALKSAGYNYFTDNTQAPDADQLKAMLGAIKTGKKPDCYKFEMSPLKA